jgi:hypothetical protein
MQLQGQQNQMSELQRGRRGCKCSTALVQEEVLFQRAEKEKLLPTEDEVTQFINDQNSRAA